jgi:hypothetical protein
VVDEFADGDRGGTASAETQEEKEEVEILNGRYRLRIQAADATHCRHSPLHSALERKR